MRSQERVREEKEKKQASSELRPSSSAALPTVQVRKEGTVAKLFFSLVLVAESWNHLATVVG